MKIVVCYVRHGQTDDNVNHLVSGHRPAELTPLGIQQAKDTGRALQNANFNHIYVSDLGRTQQTFQGISETASHLKDIKHQLTPLIREKYGGSFQGIKNQLYEDTAKERNLPIRQLKCEVGENWEDVNKRAHQFIHQLIKTHHSGDKKHESETVRVLVVTHMGFIMETHNVMNWISTKRQPQFAMVAQNCSFHEFELQYKGTDHNQIDDNLIEVTCLKNNLTEY